MKGDKEDAIIEEFRQCFNECDFSPIYSLLDTNARLQYNEQSYATSEEVVKFLKQLRYANKATLKLIAAIIEESAVVASLYTENFTMTLCFVKEEHNLKITLIDIRELC